MKKHEEGQGLVIYATILVLVAIVVIAVLLLVGPAINDVFCNIVYGLFNPCKHEQTMGIGDESVIIDVRESMESILANLSVTFGELDTLPSHGTVDNHGDGTFTYQRYADEVDSDIDDSFTFKYECQRSECQPLEHIGSVSIIVGELDPSLSVASIMDGAQQASLELDDVEESIEVLWEAAAFQEESLEEGIDLTVEAVAEGLEVLIAYADDLDEQALSEALAQLVADLKGGNLLAVPDAINLLKDELAEVPPEVWTAVSLKMDPRLTASCEALSGGLVSPDTIDAAEQAVEQLDEDHLGKAEVEQLLGEAVETIMGRNELIEEWLGMACGD